MLTSFADLVALSPHPFVRPVLSEGGPTVVQAGIANESVADFATRQGATEAEVLIAFRQWREARTALRPETATEPESAAWTAFVHATLS